MLKFLKNWTLPIAMLVGAVGYPLFICLSFLTPYLIFTMLLLTFCKVSPRDLKLRQLHVWLLLIQIIGALAAYLLLFRFDKIVAEGVMVCIICPTATAAAVITSKLGGSAASLTTYTLLANIGAAIAVPILFGSVLCYFKQSISSTDLSVSGCMVIEQIFAKNTSEIIELS